METQNYRRFTAAFLVLLMALGFSGHPSQDAQALSSGQCSKSSGEWVCNVENQNLDFYKTAALTQGDVSSTSETIGLDINSLQTFRYLDVYVDESTRIDANVTITGFVGTPELDTNSITVPHDKTVLGSLLRNGEDLSFTIDFINADTNEPVTMLNVELRVLDLDGDRRPENVVFQGLSSYTLSNPTTVTVSPSTAPDPESGQRIFSGTINNLDNSNPAAAVSAKFDSVTSLRLRTYVTGSSGSAGIIFKFGPSEEFWGDNPTTITASTSVGYGNYTVTYDANGGVGTVPTAVTASGNQTLSNGSNLVKSSIPISSWNTRSDGTGQTLSLGASFLPSGNTTLFAQYSSQTVTFNANGGTGVMQNQVSAGPTNLSANAYSRSGYSFTGWNTSSDGTGASFANSSSYPFSINETLFAQWASLPAQTVTWAPTNTSVLLSQSSVTPSSTATTSGDGVVTYSVLNAGATGCTVNSISGVVTYTGVGTCTIRATAASTENYLTSAEDVEFSISSSAPAVSLNLHAAAGAPVENSTVDYAASGLQTNSAWTLIVRSTPQTIASGTFNGGLLADSAQIPSGLEAGWHSITLTGIGANGNTISQAVWFEVGSSGNLLQTSGSEPASPTSGSGPASPASNASSATGLANTGLNYHPGPLAILMVVVGSALVIYQRRRKVQ